MRPEIGMPYRFEPTADAAVYKLDCRDEKRRLQVTGRIVYINRAHRFFTAEYELNGYRLKESFKF